MNRRLLLPTEMEWQETYLPLETTTTKKVYMKQVSKIVEIRQGEPVDTAAHGRLWIWSLVSLFKYEQAREVLWKHFSTVWRLSACQSPGCKRTVSPVPTCGTHLALWEMLCQQKGDVSIHGTDEIEHLNKKARPNRGDVEGSDGSGNGVFFLGGCGGEQKQY